MPSPSHIIIPREVTSGFRGGSLSSRNILQLNGKSFNPQPTDFYLCLCWNILIKLAFINCAVDVFLQSPLGECLSKCVCVCFMPQSNYCLSFGWWPCSFLDQLTQIHFTFCLLAAPLSHSIFSLIELADASLVATVLFVFCVGVHCTVQDEPHAH